MIKEIIDDNKDWMNILEEEYSNKKKDNRVDIMNKDEGDFEYILNLQKIEEEIDEYYGDDIMNKEIIDSIEWHKDQIFKLLEDDDLYKEEGSIQSVKSDLNEIIEKAKSKKKVWVKATATKKGHYREQEVGRKDVKEEKKGKTQAELISDDIARMMVRIKSQVKEEIIWPEEVIEDVKAYERRKKEKRGMPTSPYAPI